jgi:hypothetical protein
MRGNAKDFETTMDTEDYSFKETTWGDMHVELGTVNKEIDVSPFLKGLPDDRCQSPHWGYLFKGRIRVNYGDREEVIEAGDTYYMEPGHTAVIDRTCLFDYWSIVSLAARRLQEAMSLCA